jgi:hypothetical protein
MVDCIAVCGDSFGQGSGIPEPETFDKSFGGVVASHYGLPLKVYARSGCCNYVIYLQVKKIIEQARQSLHKPFVLVTLTNHSRFSIAVDDAPDFKAWDLADVDYTTYAPYAHDSLVKREKPFQSNRKPTLLSETASNFTWAMMHRKAPNLEHLFKQIHRKVNSVVSYFKDVYDDEIKHTHDIGLAMLMHHELLDAGIPHIIMSSEEERLRFIKRDNWLTINWGIYTQKYPDIYKSGHCDERGYKEVADSIIQKIGNI